MSDVELQTTPARAPVYTLIVYRPNAVDTCRGCVMGQSDSDFSLQTFYDEAALVQAWAQILCESAGRDREYASDEVTLLVDGLDYDAWWHTVGRSTENDTEPHSELQARAEAHSRVLREEVLRQEAARQAAVARKAREAVEAQELAAYQSLHAKYGSR